MTKAFGITWVPYCYQLISIVFTDFLKDKDIPNQQTDLISCDNQIGHQDMTCLE